MGEPLGAGADVPCPGRRSRRTAQDRRSRSADRAGGHARGGASPGLPKLDFLRRSHGSIISLSIKTLSTSSISIGSPLAWNNLKYCAIERLCLASSFSSFSTQSGNCNCEIVSGEGLRRGFVLMGNSASIFISSITSSSISRLPPGSSSLIVFVTMPQCPRSL